MISATPLLLTRYQPVSTGEALLNATAIASLRSMPLRDAGSAVQIRCKIASASAFLAAVGVPPCKSIGMTSDVVNSQRKNGLLAAGFAWALRVLTPYASMNASWAMYAALVGVERRVSKVATLMTSLIPRRVVSFLAISLRYVAKFAVAIAVCTVGVAALTVCV